MSKERSWASAATLEVRRTVQSSLSDLVSGQTVLVACSGGADSLALAAASAFAGRAAGLTVGAVIVDHQLQKGSAKVARRAQEACLALGLDPVVIARVEVGSAGGPEAAARTARYEALTALAARFDASAILLGHTREDQAETVLLRLARGSGTRSIAAMRPRAGLLRRPMLTLSRELVHTSAADICREIGHTPWQDPHNDEPRYARVRVRRALAQLGDALGPGLTAGLARSADLAAEDAQALDDWADAAFAALVEFDGPRLRGQADALAALPTAVRLRVIRRMCTDLGAAPDELSRSHVQSVDALVSAWHGQGPVSLPARVRAHREYGRLVVTTVLDAGDPVAT